MELVLRLLDGWYQKTGNQIVYDPTAVCYTIVPHSLKRLLHQRDRWQRGLMDCLIKHRNMIANPLYGMLGLATMSYQFVFELLGPICSILYMLFVFLGVYSGEYLWKEIEELEDGTQKVRERSYGLGNVWYSYLIPQIIGR